MASVYQVRSQIEYLRVANSVAALLRKLEVEKRDSLIALEPFIMAERDRAFLKHLRHLRDVEREVMKNHPGWEVGTLYGEPIYKTLPRNDLQNFDISEYYAHRPAHEAFYDFMWPEACL